MILSTDLHVHPYLLMSSRGKKAAHGGARRGRARTSLTPRFSLKTRPVARQQEHAVTGMLGALFFF